MLSAGPLTAEPSFAFHCKPHPASASLNPPPPSRLQHPQQFSTLPTCSAASKGPTSCDAQAPLCQPYASFSTAQQQLTATPGNAAHHRQAAGPSGQQSSSDMQQPQAWRAAADHGQWEISLPAADEAAGCHGAAESAASAYTPQELADHLAQLKTEFRQIYSTILDGDTQPCCPEEAAACVVSLPGSSGGVQASTYSWGVMRSWLGHEIGWGPGAAAMCVWVVLIFV